MPSVLISFREAKEPDDSRRPYLKSLIKEEGKKGKAKKAQKSKGEKKPKRKERKKVR